MSMIALTRRDDFEAWHAFAAVGTGSLEPARFFYRDLSGEEAEPTSANFDIVLVVALTQTMSSFKTAWRTCTRQVLFPSVYDMDFGFTPFACPHVPLARVQWAAEPVGARVDRIRDQLGITMTQLAAALQLQRVTLYRWYEGRQPHAGNLARLAAIEAFARAWSTQGLPALRKYWEVWIPANNLRVRDVLTDPLRNAGALVASVPLIRSTTRPAIALDPYTPKRRARHAWPSALDQDSPSPWDHDE